MFFKKILFSLTLSAASLAATAQTNPAVTSWLRNTTGITGRHYIAGNSTPIVDTAKANVQLVRYSDNYSYINCSGIPSYIIGPYQDGNPSIAGNNNWLFKIPLNPVANSGTLTSVGLGNIGVLINGVPIYNFADGKSYLNQNNWHQSAVVFEMAGFDCAKGHPSPNMQPGGTNKGRYHHHQNPTAFNLDQNVISNVCDLYLADGLYVMDPSVHSPLLGFAFDGFPIYGAYAYANSDGTGGIARMRSSYQYKNITTRTNGPTLSEAPLGSYSEDFEFIAGSGDLDVHNGRFAVTPEYPNGTYAYYTTVDENQNSAYPYIIGPKYYGVVTSQNNVIINEPVNTYTGVSAVKNQLDDMTLSVFPNPTADLIIIQSKTMLEKSLQVDLVDMNGRVVLQKPFYQGSTICHFETETIYNGVYFLTISDGVGKKSFKVVIER